MIGLNLEFKGLGLRDCSLLSVCVFVLVQMHDVYI